VTIPGPSAGALVALRETFGFDAFRPGQADVVAAAEAGRDVLFVAPTGSGKSVAYWVPGLVGGGLSVVVSPLIALMVDQVARLNQLGVAAACVHSQMDAGARQRALDSARGGALRFLYLAPERVANAGFLDVLGQLRVDRFVVDEAHCISAWGHDFRPEYRRLAEAIDACGRPPVSAYTATATPRVRDDIRASLRLRDPVERVTGFVRPNLVLSVVRCRGKTDKMRTLLERIEPAAGRALVYCGRVSGAEEVAAELSSAGVAAAAYHGRLDAEYREAVYEEFASGGLKVVVATSAFGMGVDFPDIRQVIHFDFPGSLEDYYQQAGRAGRDGEAAECILLYSPADRDLHEFFIEQAYPERDAVRAVYRELLREGTHHVEDWPARLPALDARQVEAALGVLDRAGVLLPGGAIRRLTGAPVDFDEQARLKENAYARLHQVMDYARSTGCRHARIADYFGEAGVARTCASCDNCLGGRADALEPVGEAEVRAALAAVARFDGHLGATRLASLLAGQVDAWVRARDWVERLPFFGALRGWPPERARELLDELAAVGLVRRTHGERPTLELTADGHVVLQGHEQVDVRLARAAVSRGRGAQPAPGAPDDLDGPATRRFHALRDWRTEVARRAAVPAYVVFTDRTLLGLASANPTSLAGVRAVPGVGATKLEKWGPDVLAVLAAAG